ncbi:cytochrome P450 (plasmid) [Azospirillum sp. B510]|uniref:cytochrome P450 n=1 Tax=Azospirillum sp. (strain B510) TaxID=137722 RepID=UPI0001C4CB21|nr:cytochrome P450 [Azospirillum sp. B510]BAI74816.1 cytochrome P450 [Azospirillum sp. B510]
MNASAPRIRDFDDPSFDPFSAVDEGFGPHVLDPYQRLAELRREAPVHHIDYRVLFGLEPDITLGGLPHALVVSYDAVAQVYNDPVTFSNTIYERNLGIAFGRSISVMDAPEHPRYRRIFQKAFLPNIVSKWGESLVAPVIDRLLERFIDRGHADLVKEFTALYPFQVIYEQLGLPKGEVEVFHKLAAALTTFSVDPRYAMEASAKLGEYYDALTDLRAQQPGDDLISLLATAEVDGERLPKDVVVSFLRQLNNAAGDTTYRATSCMMMGLLSNPEQFDAVRRDRSLIPAVIEEAIRWECPVLVGSRQAIRDVTLCGVDIPAGTVIDVGNGAANRDEARYPDPDRFDIFRPAGGARHFGFAYGPHVCIGQHLARVEMTRALTGILDRLPNLRLDPERPAPQIRGINLRAPSALHVVFG